MKVLFAIGSGPGWGGARSIGVDLLEASIKLGVSPHVLAWTRDPVTQAAESMGLPVTLSETALTDIRHPWGLFTTADLIRSVSPDVVYTYYLPPIRAFIRASARYARVPAVAHQFGELHLSSRPSVALLQRALDRGSSRLRGATIAPSRAVFEQLRTLGVPLSQLHLIPYGVNASAVQAADAPLRPDVLSFIARFDQTVAVLARLDANKNQLGALRVFARAAPPDCCLVLVGGEDEPGYQGVLNCELAALGIADRVMFTGDMDRLEVWSLLHHVHVLLHLSFREGFGIAPLEAQAVGVPVIASGAGGLRDVVADGRSGFVVPVGDTGQAEERLCELLRDDTYRTSMGLKAEEWVREKFDLDESHRAVVSLLEGVATPPSH